MATSPSSKQQSGLSKYGDLKGRLIFLALALVVYRIGAHVPVPGIDPDMLKQLFDEQQGGILGLFNMFSGGALSRFSVFALGIMPYISASIIMQMLSYVLPELEALRKEGESGRRKITQYTRYGTLLLGLFQGFGIAVALESQAGLVLDPGFMFRITTTISLLTGTMFLMWLGEQITGTRSWERYFDHHLRRYCCWPPERYVWSLPARVHGCHQPAGGHLRDCDHPGGHRLRGLHRTWSASNHRQLCQAPDRQQDLRRPELVSAAQDEHVGCYSPDLCFVSDPVPGYAGPGWFTSGDSTRWIRDLAAALSPGQPLYTLLYAVLIVFFAYFYTALVFNPKETAENLKKSGAFIPGIRPGDQTARYIDRVLLRLTLGGAVYLVFVCLVPEFLNLRFNVPFYFGGTSLLIVVVVTMDFMSQVQAYLMTHQYESLLRKTNFRGLGQPKH